MRDGDTAVEIGSAPGGASYALLKRGDSITNLVYCNDLFSQRMPLIYIPLRGRPYLTLSLISYATLCCLSSRSYRCGDRSLPPRQATQLAGIHASKIHSLKDAFVRREEKSTSCEG